MDSFGAALPIFDRRLELPDLLPRADADSLTQQLAGLTGAPVSLYLPNGELYAGPPDCTGTERPVTYELEPVGMLRTAASEEAAAAAVRLVELAARAGARYQMASDLHLTAVHEDYQRLQEEHRRLEASEASYRALSESLERRVAQQVNTIQAAQRKLYEAEKMASVGQLAAGVAHEINNPIGFAKSNLQTGLDYLERIRRFADAIWTRFGSAPECAELRRQMDLDFILEDFGQLLNESRDGMERVARIVADLKGFSQVDQAQVTMADLNEVITRVINIARNRLSADAELIVDLNPLPATRCDQGRLGQAILNLLLNAADSLSGVGTIRIESRPSGDGAAIAVCDSGVGIAPENLSRVFDPFFTTKEVGKGTGLGLTVCKDIVDAHGGRIAVDSTPSQGTRVTLWLPRAP